MKNYKELSIMTKYQTLCNTYAETQKESKKFAYVNGLLSKFWNGTKGNPVSYKSLFAEFGFNKPSEIKTYIENAQKGKGKNPNVPDCFYNEKGLLCRCVSVSVYVGKGKERTTKKDENGKVVKENKYTPIRSWSIKTLLDLFMQIDNVNNPETGTK